MNSEIRKHRTLDGRPGLLVLAIAGLAVALAAGLPLSGVAERTTATAGASVGGGLGVPGKPQIKGFTCLERCVAPLKATPGSRLRITGAYLNRVLKVVFRTEGGTIGTRFVDRDPASVEVDVPDKAVTGKIYAVTGTGTVGRVICERRATKAAPPRTIAALSRKSRTESIRLGAIRSARTGERGAATEPGEADISYDPSFWVLDWEAG